MKPVDRPGARRFGTGVAVSNVAKAEDRATIVRRAHNLFADVYDGHGGDMVAELAALRLHSEFYKCLDLGQSAHEAFTGAFLAIDAMALELRGGAAATAVLIRNEEITAAHVDDCRAILVSDGDAEVLTKDHSVQNPSEYQRLREHGARIWRSYVLASGRGIATTRSLGDSEFRLMGIVPVPEVVKRGLSKSDAWVILASDGLWRAVDHETIGEIAPNGGVAQEVAEELCALATEGQFEDDATAVVLDLRL